MDIRKVRLAFQELKFIRSYKDLKIFFQKVSYLQTRFLSGAYKPTHVPPSLQLEPTNYCNLRCICCTSASSARKKGYMEIELFQKILDEAAHLKIKHIHLYLHGEPMLHPKITEMIKLIKSKDIALHVTTNGMLFNEDKILKILQSGVNSADHFMFSVLGHSRDTHENIMRGVKQKKVRKNISDFISLRKKYGINGPVIETILYVMPENAHEATDFLRYWRGKVDHTRVVGKISEFFSEYHSGEVTTPIRTYGCSNIWERLTIAWNGEVILCCADIDGTVILGNLGEHSINEIWNSSKLLNIKKLHTDKKIKYIPLCSRCDM